MKNKFVILLLVMFSSFAYAQKVITWQDLAKISYEEKYFEEFEEYFLYPTFSEEIHALEGTEVSITGYFLNVDPRGAIFILSKGPMSSCFFCGVGGPETAIEIQFEKEPEFQTDDIIEVTGTLKLNKDDVEHFNYILTNCRATAK